GEHGRGFAVVAEEVRRLADSSAHAAENVTKTVEFIRRQVREVSGTMEIGSAKVAGVEGVAQAAAGALNEIARAVDDVHRAATAGGVEGVAQAAAGALNEIAGAGDDVHRAATQVARETDANRKIVDALGERTQQVAQSANEHAAASQEVTAAAEEQSASTEE